MTVYKGEVILLKNIKKKIIPLVCILPFVVGTIGYLASGEMFTNALYASFLLYFTSQIYDAYNGFIEFARWTAPLVTVSAILSVMGTIWNNIRWCFKCLSSNSVAIYSNEPIKIEFSKPAKPIYPGDKIKPLAKSHIILFSSDYENFNFYEKNKKRLQNKPVYIGICELEMGLLKENEEVVYFDINAAIARTLWKKIRIWERHIKNLDIVIYGESILTQSIISYGLLCNLYSREQHVRYHIITKNITFQVKHSDLCLQNGDEIKYYHEFDMETWNVVKNADICIVADKKPIDFLQTMLVNSKELYFYAPKVEDISAYFEYGNIQPFGKNEEILTDENIRKQKLVQSGIELHKSYINKYCGETEWNKLSGFFKNSNISAADYEEVLQFLAAYTSDEELAELEHIRWCRFHYLNYWKYGELKNGIRRDGKNRIHRDLILYEELDEKEKNKNLDMIKKIRKVY